MQPARELRAKFLESDGYGVVDGNRVPFDSLSVRTMNFGQHWRTPNVSEVCYSLELPRAFFVWFVSENLAELIDDTKRFPDETEPLDRALIDAGFPGVEAAINHPVLSQELASFWAYDALLLWLGDGGPQSEPGFVLNSFERILFGATGLLLEGKGRRSGIRVTYQDV